MANIQQNQVQFTPKETLDNLNPDQLYKNRLLNQIYKKDQPQPDPKQQEKDYLEAMNDEKMFHMFMSNMYNSMK